MTGLLKQGFAVWTRVPGTPFTLPGAYTPRERLPGMSEWAPRDMIERVSQHLKQNRSIEDIAHAEQNEGLLGRLGLGGAIGATGGGLLGRLLGGEGATAPFKKIISEGLGSKTLAGLKNLPGPMKWAPALGAGAGLLAGASQWGAGRAQRGEQARDVTRGLLAEKVLQRGALSEAVKTRLPYTAPLLRGVPIMSASSPPPYVTVPGSMVT